MKKFIFLSVVLVTMGFLMAAIYTEEHSSRYVYAKKTVLPPPVPSAPNPHLDEVLESFEATLEQIMSKSGIPGAAVAILKDTSVVFLKGFGVKEIGTTDSVDAKTVFRIGSVSKCFASFVTGVAAQEHLVNWDDEALCYVDNFCLKSPEETNRLTIRHILSHTTGLPYHTYTNLVEEGLELRELLNKLQEVNLSSHVGSTYSYQNVAYSLIDEVLLEATGKSYNDLMHERVFDPLNMTTASLTYRDFISNCNIARPHLKRRDGWRKIPISTTYYNVAPAGGINASITDMAQWMKALLGQREDVISEQTLTEMYTPFVDARSKNRNYRAVAPIKGTYYGLGWRVLHYPQDTIIYHGGYVNGYRSEVAIHQRDKIAICILANAPGDVADTGIPAFLQLYFDKREAIAQWEEQNKFTFEYAKAF